MLVMKSQMEKDVWTRKSQRTRGLSPEKHSHCEKLAEGEEWVTRTAETTSPVGDPRPLLLALLTGSLSGCSWSEKAHKGPSCLTHRLLC